MENRGIAGVVSQAQVVPMVQMPLTAFIELKDKIIQLSERVELLESMTAVGSEWLTREQAMAFLQCGSTTLHNLRRTHQIKSTTSGTSKPLFCKRSLQTYLEKKGVSKEEIDQRFRKNLLERRKKLT
ncbi:hypothetical protein GCM10023189_42890 [Nibrella saemangeumensis]|uniref:Helix-turn-helix domain-containing protein n=1 Tax=Nibrella saemangeumensis TaxID=1084526 RepID=A0ABP8NEI6_9BACT